MLCSLIFYFFSPALIDLSSGRFPIEAGLGHRSADGYSTVSTHNVLEDGQVKSQAFEEKSFFYWLCLDLQLL